jgi:hypothetical protein
MPHQVVLPGAGATDASGVPKLAAKRRRLGAAVCGGGAAQPGCCLSYICRVPGAAGRPASTVVIADAATPLHATQVCRAGSRTALSVAMLIAARCSCGTTCCGRRSEIRRRLAVRRPWCTLRRRASGRRRPTRTGRVRSARPWYSWPWVGMGRRRHNRQRTGRRPCYRWSWGTARRLRVACVGSRHSLLAAAPAGAAGGRRPGILPAAALRSGGRGWRSVRVRGAAGGGAAAARRAVQLRSRQGCRHGRCIRLRRGGACPWRAFPTECGHNHDGFLRAEDRYTGCG